MLLIHIWLVVNHFVSEMGKKKKKKKRVKKPELTYRK